MLSIIVPTYNEGDNVSFLAGRVKEVLKNTPYELIFVDDSRDNTTEKLARLAERDPSVRYEHRGNERGLGTAVVRGFQLAGGEVLVVMDADLQHPPEMLRDMVRAADLGADVVIASRFLPGGGDGGLGPLRKIVSFTARWLGKAALRSLRRINDPTAGFFLVRKTAIQGVELRPLGWKILVEILVRGRYASVVEIPYEFKARVAGKSKMATREQWNYLRHLFLLAREHPGERRFYASFLSALLGMSSSILVYYLMVRIFGLPIIASDTISTLLATCGTFFLNNTLTWPDFRPGRGWTSLLQYLVASGGGIPVNVGVLGLLYYRGGMGYLPAMVAGAGAAFAWNLVVSAVWARRMEGAGATISRWVPGHAPPVPGVRGTRADYRVQ